MKTKKIYIKTLTIAVLFAAGAFSSCSDFLDQEPKSKVPTENLYQDVQTAKIVIDGLYVSYNRAKAGRDGFTFSLLGTDEVKQGIVQMGDASQASLDYYNGRLNGTSPQVNTMWSKRWPAINTASEAILGLKLLADKETEESALKNITSLKASVHFIRAMSMFEIAMYWGEIPVIEVDDLKNTANIDRSRQPLDVVWKQIHDDLEFASKNLPTGKQANGNQATQGAAIAMLGKLHMYAPEASGFRDYDKAIEYFKQIEKTYKLETKYATLFDEYGKCEFNSNESIFELDFTPNDLAPAHWQWDMGSRTLANLGESCYIGGYDVSLPTEYAYKMKSDGGLWEDGDQRRAVSIREDYTYMGVTYTVPSWGADELDPHIKKWEDRRLDNYTKEDQAKDTKNGRSMYWSGKNYLFLRHADILLCYAECLNETDKTSEAMDMVNTVRKRAWGGKLPADKEWKGLSKEQFRVEIMDERMRELCFEGWRRMDLIRTGKFADLIKERNKWAKESGTIQDYHMLYPIPEVEIKNNPFMSMEKDQNPGY
ncbi:RagB/SusD family nutrient uptake outer membrane protein [Dysgonomonas sp. 520]|uniref:RagB/SusD family nutrient uptake outer membrane protein n=1 Tax=Dysgonomonas sp. 520 TaxID=2302931 RepID=UPI0013D4C4A5|nr:RagB/SusD family nutrient uptake outer membrane protein [Dysgonomonas sp. 520]NDW08579.1 RagB/SusD family nutrient uptake outer membrane protein [Dysgonomonas sp. 520]